jgi:hypothetical protein
MSSGSRLPGDRYAGTVPGMDRRQPCYGTGTSQRIDSRRPGEPIRTCGIMTDNPTGLCNFCRKTEGKR